MNEQRKVIYKRRDQILDGEDLRSTAMEYLAEAVDADHHALRVGGDRRMEYRRAGDRAHAVLANSIAEEQFADVSSTDELNLLMADATAHYERQRRGTRLRGAAPGRAPGDAAHHRPALA